MVCSYSASTSAESAGTLGKLVTYMHPYLLSNSGKDSSKYPSLTPIYSVISVCCNILKQQSSILFLVRGWSGGGDWVASCPPWVCTWGVHTTNSLFEHSLIYLVVEHWQLQEHVDWHKTYPNESTGNFVMCFAHLFSHLSFHFSKSAPASISRWQILELLQWTLDYLDKS